MILHALVEHYEDLAALGKISKPGWGLSKVSYALSLSLDGELLNVTPTLIEVEQGKKTVLRPQEMTVPEPVIRSSGISANFLCDNSSYFLGIDNKGKPERAKECFAACAERHEAILEGIDNPVAKAILLFFSTWNPDESETNPALAEYLEEVKAGVNLVFRIDGKYAHEDEDITEAWQYIYNQKEAEETSPCLVTGQSAIAVELHPKIKGVSGAQSSGANLVSFNSSSVESYGKEQGNNSPVGEYAAFAYGAALNTLLADREHTQLLGDTTLVFWAKGGQEVYQDLFGGMFGGGESDKIDNSGLKAAIERLADGKVTRWDDIEVSPDTPFYVLGLSPNAARISVRFFLRDNFGTFARRMWEHQQRLEIVRPAFDSREELSYWALLRETINPNSRDKKASPIMTGELIHAVLSGGRYPATLLNSVMLRIRAEREITRGRAAIIKAYYLHNPHQDCPEEVLTVAISDSKNPAYLMGRAFSVLEAIQSSANPSINATIKDKYFNSASATPATVFPILINLAQHHLRKLETGAQIYHEKELTAILGDLGDTFPKRLTLPAQGSFQLGYYHQTQKRYEKKKEDDKDA